VTAVTFSVCVDGNTLRAGDRVVLGGSLACMGLWAAPVALAPSDIDGMHACVLYCTVLDIGYWILDIGYWILDIGYWILDTVYCIHVNCINVYQLYNI
jgi:hypothetical protein